MLDLTWAQRIQIAQGASALAWLALTLLLSPAVHKVLTGRAQPINVFAALLAFVGLTQVGFTVRWYIWRGAVSAMGPTETSFWLALYTASTVEALAFLVAARAWRRLNP